VATEELMESAVLSERPRPFVGRMLTSVKAVSSVISGMVRDFALVLGREKAWDFYFQSQ
jgi:hypothetical protein